MKTNNISKTDVNNALTLSFLSEKGIFKIMETASTLLEQELEITPFGFGTDVIINHMEFKFKLKSNKLTYVKNDLNSMSRIMGSEGRLYLQVSFPENDEDFKSNPMIVLCELNDLNDLGLSIIGNQLSDCGIEILCYDKIRQKIKFLTEEVGRPTISSSID